MDKIGVWLTSYGDEKEMTRTALTSFLATADFPYRLLVHITMGGPGMTALRKEFLSEPDVYFIFESTDLSLVKAFNESAAFLMRDPEVKWLSSIHNDMEFPRPWLRTLVTRLESDRTIGKIHPINIRDGDLGSPNAVEREGNECPWVTRRSVWEELEGADENFVDGGSSEDWDFNRRLISNGYRVVITPAAQIMHLAEQTRWKYGTTNPVSDTYNRDYYFKKWGDNNPAV